MKAAGREEWFDWMSRASSPWLEGVQAEYLVPASGVLV
jgi:hypothetical protein